MFNQDFPPFLSTAEADDAHKKKIQKYWTIRISHKNNDIGVIIVDKQLQKFVLIFFYLFKIGYIDVARLIKNALKCNTDTETRIKN